MISVNPHWPALGTLRNGYPIVFFDLMKIKWKIIVFGPQKLRSVLINELGNAFITSRLKNCDSLFLGLPLSSIAFLQIVQNAAASLLTRAKKTDHVTPILASLPWLPVNIRIQ